MNHTLQNWLETATQNLAPAAKARVKEQILEHHAAALEQHQPKPNAQALALADLGNAEEAAKKFEQAYLTTRELEVLVGDKRRLSNGSLLVQLFILGVACLSLYFALRSGSSSVWIIGATVLTGLLQLFMTLCARHLGLRQFTNINLTLHLGSLLLAPIWFYVVGRWMPDLPTALAVFMAGIFVWSVWTMYRKYPMWRKIM